MLGSVGKEVHVSIVFRSVPAATGNRDKLIISLALAPVMMNKPARLNYDAVPCFMLTELAFINGLNRKPSKFIFLKQRENPGLKIKQHSQQQAVRFHSLLFPFSLCHRLDDARTEGKECLKLKL